MKLDSLLERLDELSTPSSKLKLADLLETGFFPKELPPPFKTKVFSDVVTDPSLKLPIEFTKKKNTWTDYCPYSLARPGSLRRKLAILNPLSYYRISAELVKHQEALFKKASLSIVCLSHPEITPSGSRSIAPRIELSELPSAKARSRVGKRFILRTDISRFYPSIYTHALDWAITGKAKAKAKFGKSVDRLGKRMDELIQAAQNGQTRGIPIGPDVSFLLAHILLAPVDRELKRNKITHGFRFMDDYELGFSTRSEAEHGLAVLEEALSDYELELNPLKTAIVELPDQIDNPAIVSLRGHRLDEHLGSGNSSLVSFFNKAFEFAKSHPNKPVLRYAVGRINRLSNYTNPDLTQDLVLQCATVEPGVWPTAIPILLKLDSSSGLKKEAVRIVIESTLLQEAPRQHSSEVAWALWAALVFATAISRKATKEVIKMGDNVSMLLLLHAEEEGLVEFDDWCHRHITTSASARELYQDNWLFAYEAVVKGWVKPETDHVSSDPVFGFLSSNSVCFYDKSQLALSRVVPDDGEDVEDDVSDYSVHENDDDILTLLDEPITD